VTLELQNLGPYPRELAKGMRVAQLVFLGMSAPPEFAYGEGGRGHYQGQAGATKAWSDEFFPRVSGPRKAG
jgi:deoxycytidine triphosphate deaminase